MVTIEQGKITISRVVRHVCGYLSMDESSIRIIYAPCVEPLGLFIKTMTVLEDDSIVIGEDALAKCSWQGFTSLRSDLYACVRFIAKRRERGGWLGWNEAAFDADAFSSAILFLDGNQLPCPKGVDVNCLFGGALAVLSNEFGMDCTLIEMPTDPYDDASFYKIRLSQKNRLELLQNFLQPVPFCARFPQGEEKGTRSNPFDNVNHAVEYLKAVEKEAFERDTRIQDITNKRYFYDTNYQMFRILWASPYVANQKNTFPASSFIMSQLEPLPHSKYSNYFYCLKPNLYKRKFLYRGQSDCYDGLPCVPNMFRSGEHNAARYYLDYMIFSQELELVVKSHPIVRLLEKGIEIKHDVFRIRMHYSGLAQHYYNKSDYLDFTSNIDVVRFFATTNYKDEKYYPNEDVDKIGVIYYYELKYPEAFQQHNGYAMKNIGKQVFVRSGLQGGFLLEMAKGVDLKKDVDEVHAVYFKHNKEISKQVFKDCNNGEIFFADDLLQHAWRDRLQKRFEDKVVSKAAVLLNVSRNKEESEESITNKLSTLGIKVDDFVPEFTREELKVFYSQIDKWWDEFCDDIHFADPEDDIYRQEMKDLIRNPKYKWAFEYK